MTQLALTFPKPATEAPTPEPAPARPAPAVCHTEADWLLEAARWLSGERETMPRHPRIDAVVVANNARARVRASWGGA